jgi:ribonucleoside-diphosphate reductase alpha chain
VNEYPLPEIRDNCQDVRRIGLGIMGLHSLLIELGYRYSSTSAKMFVNELMDFLKRSAYTASIELAQEKGQFPVLDREAFINSGFAKNSLPEYLKRGILEHGIRNCAVLTIAPTGTTGMVSNVSTGIEPLFSAAYWRRFYRPTADGTRSLDKQLVVDPLWDKLEAQGKDVSVLEGAYDISPEGHFEIQRICQSHIDNATSKTINLPETYPVESLSDLWLEYLPYLKGTTLYRAGSRGEEPLEAIPLDEAKRLMHQNVVHADASVTEQNSMDCVGDNCAVPSELKPHIEEMSVPAISFG